MRQLLLCGMIALSLPSLAAAQAAPSAAEYLAAAGASDAFEIQSGRLAEMKAVSLVTRHFAQRMVLDHTACEGVIAAAASRSGVPMSAPRLTSDQEAMLAQLARESGPSFDRLYLSQQLATHQAVSALEASYAAGGGDPGLRDVATRVIPMLSMHLRMLAAIQTSSR